MYKIIDTVEKILNPNWKGLIIQDIQTGKFYITTGLFIWSLLDHRKNQLKHSENVNCNDIINKWNSKFYSKIIK